MKKIITVISLNILLLLVNSAWTAMQTKYAPLAKKGEIAVFDINGKQTEWPIWVRDMSSEVLYQEKEIDLIWVDNMKFHYNQPYWESMQKLFKIATALSKTGIKMYAAFFTPCSFIISLKSLLSGT